jgi:hypothetical protein
VEGSSLFLTTSYLRKVRQILLFHHRHPENVNGQVNLMLFIVTDIKLLNIPSFFLGFPYRQSYWLLLVIAKEFE